MSSSSTSRGPVLLVVLAALLAAGLGTVLFRGSSSGPEPLVVYCAHDSIFSEKVLRRFERETGIPVSIRFDTEATKSLGLVQLLLREKEHPRCDVFWNNQVLGTMALQQQGVLHPYKGEGYARIPQGLKDPDGHWAGFAGRLRVFIVNTDRMPATDDAIEQALEGDLSRMAMAKPLYGTTLTHYSLLWHHWGGERLKEWHRDVRQRGLKEVNGNAVVKDLVAGGTCDFGWTDTDDFYVAVDDGYPVAMRPVRVEGKVICIPNSVAIIKGTDRLPAAQRLVDYLLSAETELALAASRSRQIPLGPVDESQLSDEVRQLKTWADESCDLWTLAPARAACLDWLKSEYLQ